MQLQSSKSSRVFFLCLSVFYGVVIWSLVLFSALICYEVWSGVRATHFEGRSFVLRDGHYVSVNPQMPEVSFSADKGKDVFRVFVFGSSQAMGWPYVQNQSHLLPRLLGFENRGGLAIWLQCYLSALMPDREIEVYNATMDMGSPMRRAVEVYREIIGFAQPDLCIILDGNNEDWEIARLDRNFNGHDFSPSAMKLVSAEFERHLYQILEICDKERVETFLLTVPNNIRNYRPEDPVPAGFESVWELIENGRYQSAIERLNEFPGAQSSAPVLFYTGLCYDRLGDFERAKGYYLAAKDSSGLCQMHRCRSRWNDIIRSFAGKSGFLHVFDFERYLFQHSKDSIPGYDLFLSGCHMNIKGNRIAARGVTEFFCRVNGMENVGSLLDNVSMPELDADKLILNYRLQKAKLTRQRLVLSVFRSKYGLSRLIYGNNVSDNIANYDRLINELRLGNKQS